VEVLSGSVSWASELLSDCVGLLEVPVGWVSEALLDCVGLFGVPVAWVSEALLDCVGLLEVPVSSCDFCPEEVCSLELADRLLLGIKDDKPVDCLLVVNKDSRVGVSVEKIEEEEEGSSSCDPFSASLLAVFFELMDG
jgi:hypothetical protein